MSYETNTASGPNDLLDRVRIVLAANGWTQDVWTLEGSNRRLTMHKGGDYIHAKASNDGSNIWPAEGTTGYQIGFTLATGNAAGNAWADQADVILDGTRKGGCGMGLISGSMPYHLFYDAATDSMVLYVMVNTNVWHWLGWGLSMNKAGSFTGGKWMSGCANWAFLNYNLNYPGQMSTLTAYPFGATHDPAQLVYYPLNYVRADVDSFTGKWVGCSNGSRTGKAGAASVKAENYEGGQDYDKAYLTQVRFIHRTRNFLNGMSVLFPCLLFAARDAGGYSLLGSIPNVFNTNITGLNPGQSYTVGSSEYVAFPGNTSTSGTVVRKT